MTVFSGHISAPRTTSSLTSSTAMSEGGSGHRHHHQHHHHSHQQQQQTNTGSVGETPGSVLDSNFVFAPGITVECRTALKTTLTGQVVCFDQSNRLLVIRDFEGEKAMLRFINLALVEHVTHLKDVPVENVWPSINQQSTPKQIDERVRRAEAHKKSSIMQADVPIEGQLAFINLRKTLDQKVEWSGINILVLDCVIVRPPYTQDSVEHIGDISDTAVANAKEHVRKILSKNRSLQQSRTSCDDAPADPTPSR